MTSTTDSKTENYWRLAIPLSKLQQSSMLLARIEGKQIALFNTPIGVRACDNRCPHEGFPLSQGSLSDQCTLTCNWHNWKFDLNTGENLYRGDKLRTYPTEIRGEDIWIDLSEPPYDEQYTAIVDNLKDAFDEHVYDRIARELARLVRLGSDPLDVLRLAIQWSWQRLEFGWTHAYAGMADWLTLYDENAENSETQLVCLVESVAHVAFDVLREQHYPFSEEIRSYSEAEFVEAIEEENEVVATAMIRGALRDGLKFCDLEAGFTFAALAHYNDFGHSLIYLTKAEALINRLGPGVTAPLLLSLTRGLVFASREDKIPEFKHYGPSLALWGKKGKSAPKAERWHQRGIKGSLKLTLESSQTAPEKLYQELLLANAVNLLSFDIDQQYKVHITVSGNVGWLDFTHGITFANAVRKQCHKFPELWPQGLLQMACFCGRHGGFTTAEIDPGAWHSESIEEDINQILERVLNHDQDEYIVSVHWLKLAMAVREEIQNLSVEQGNYLIAALNRFISSPVKLRQPRRTAYQSIQFVAKG